MMNKGAKKIYVEEMKKNFTTNESVMIAQYQGLNVTELDELRKELRDKGILFKITKNRITKIAIKETPVKDLEKYFTGPTAAAISSDPITTAKILNLAIADVDIMFLNKRLLFLEVNSYPGIEGIEKATSKDITNRFIIAIEKKLKFKSL